MTKSQASEKWSKARLSTLVTVGFVALIAFFLALYICSPVYEDPFESKMIGMLDGAMIAYWVFLYYHFIEFINSGRAEPYVIEKPNKRITKLIKAATYLIETNHQSMSLRHFPLSFFRKNKIDKVRIDAGCDLTSQAPSVIFTLEHHLPVCDNYIFIESKRLPVEIAPDWLKKEPKYIDAINKERERLEERLKKECDLGSLKILKRAV